MKAKNREQYVEAWQSHVRELVHVFLDAERPINDWEETKASLMGLIDEAADRSFSDIDCGACTVAIGAHTRQEGCREQRT